MTKPLVTSQHSLRVGSPGDSFISFEIESAEDTELFALLEIPCGVATTGNTSLCRDAQLAQLKVECNPAKTIVGTLTRDGSLTSGNNKLLWVSESFAMEAGNKVSLRLTGFNLAGSGDASLNLKLWSDPDEPALPYDVTTTVPIQPAVGPAIIDFDISAHRVMQGDTITLTAYTTNAKTVILYHDNNRKIEPSEESASGGIETKRVYTHQLEANTKFRLEAWRDSSGGSMADLAKREITVEVDPRPHWFSRDILANSLRGDDRQQKFYPTLLLAAKDLGGAKDGERLYGIFVNKNTKDASLWSSDSGLDGWRWESDVPPGMGESPGVIHNQVLWLIGGSAVDPDSEAKATNRLWWYYRDDKTGKMVWTEWDPKGEERKQNPEEKRGPAARKCHTIASFEGKVWVLGGLSARDAELDDVWACVADPRKRDFTPTWTKMEKLPSARCMSAAAATPEKNAMRGVDHARLWLLGGTTHPYNINETLDDLLWTEDGKSWHKLEWPATIHNSTNGQQQTSLAKPLGATIFYSKDDKRLHIAGIFREPVFKACDYALLDVDLEKPSWPEGLLKGFGWSYKTDLFLIRSVTFGERWIFWPVYHDWKDMNQYTPRIFNTPKES